MSKLTKQEERILENSFETISREGIKNFTVDSFSQDIGMSKKTIYKFFPTKETLIEKTMGFFTSLINRKFKSVLKSKDNPAIQFITIMDFILKQSQIIPISKVAELKSRYPNIWKKLEIFRLKRKEDFYIILKNGQDTGFVRTDIDVDIVATLYINITNSTFQPDFFLKNNLTPQNAVGTFLKIITQGIFTEKGMAELKNTKIYKEL
jgi:TetR/AcrR family transcriptional regulator, cholesterol catabolism regulator